MTTSRPGAFRAPGTAGPAAGTFAPAGSTGAHTPGAAR